jgi:exonuclease III
MNSSSITITAWNINGLRHRTLGNKLSNSDFTKNIKDHDLIFLVETWSNQTDSIPGFKAISTCTAQPKTNSSCRISGGITLLIKNTLQPLIYTEN